MAAARNRPLLQRSSAPSSHIAGICTATRFLGACGAVVVVLGGEFALPVPSLALANAYSDGYCLIGNVVARSRTPNRAENENGSRVPDFGGLPLSARVFYLAWDLAVWAAAFRLQIL